MKLWQRISSFFENGDLVPFAVIVSIFHYGPVLVAAGENAIVAYIIGTMTDLIHFRSVRRFFDAPGWVAGTIGIATSGMALMYHMRFYGNDWLLAAPIPLGIAILAQHAAAKRQDIVSTLQAQNKTLYDDNKRLRQRRNIPANIGPYGDDILQAVAGTMHPRAIADKHGRDIRTVKANISMMNGAR